jgi:serine protease AprX
MNRVSKIINLKWAHDRNIYGKDIGVAVIDTGISMHPDFVNESNRIVAFKDFIHGRISPYDDNGHGTHVTGIVGGNGKTSGGLYTGIAPQCNLICIKVLNHKGNGNISDVLSGLEWVVKNRNKYNIRIVNISVGTAIKKDIDENSFFVKGVDEVWNSGIVVLAAAGNNGPNPQTIGAPGNSRKIITVGASDDDIVVDLFGAKVKDYSGRGPTSYCIKKPDIVAPGSNITSCNVVKNVKVAIRKNLSTTMYTSKSGTSMATPIVSGAVALLLSVDPGLSNKDVKMRLRNSGKDLGYPWSKQGWGLLNIKDMLGGCV